MISTSRSITSAAAGTLAFRQCLFLCVTVLTSVTASAEDAASSARSPFTAVTNAVAWEQLPECTQGRDAPLPHWARMLAPSLPHLTAALLELDGTFRLSQELEPRLAAKLRLIAARANRSEYAEAYALADLRQAGADDREIATTRIDNLELPPAEQAALMFAHKMTVAAHSVTDEEVAGLVRDYGEPKVVAMILQMAYANFFDRLVLTLGTPVEADGPLPAQAFQFPALADPSAIPAADRVEIDLSKNDTSPDLQSLLKFNAWTPLTFDSLQLRMQRQRDRTGRISVPLWEDVHAKLPPGMYPKDRPMKIRWSLVVLGHQPKLGAAWLRCLRVFGKEAHLDRVFEESIFWVVTRSLQCFY